MKSNYVYVTPRRLGFTNCWCARYNAVYKGGKLVDSEYDSERIGEQNSVVGIIYLN